MATPTPPAGDAPRRTLKTSGTTAIPTRRLVSASGQAIEAKSTANPLKRGATAAIPTARKITTAIPSGKRVTKAIASAAKVPTDEEIAAAREAEDARLVAEQAEYERQMEEYNKQMEEHKVQMEEYERQVAEQAEVDRIAAEKATAEKAEADRIATEEEATRKAEEEKAAAVRAAAEKAAADAAKAAEKAAAEAALAAAKLAAAEATLAAQAAAEAAKAAMAEAHAVGGQVAPAPEEAKTEPKTEAKPAAKLAPKLSVKPALAKAKPAEAGGKASATQLIRKGAQIPAPATNEAAPSSALLRSAAASAQAKSLAKPPATKMLAAAAKKAAPAPAPAPAPEPAPATAADEPVASDLPEEEVPVEMSEEELAARDSYLNALQLDADAKPMWKKPPFLIACGVLLAVGAGCFYHVYTTNAAKEAYDKNVAETNLLLRQAGEINKAGAETLEDVQKKGIALNCTLADAEKLMGVIVDPFQKDERGVNRFGGAPKGVAQNAGLLLGIMAEKDPAIETMIFKSLEQNAAKIDPDLFSWMIQRLGVAEVKNINSKLKTLSERIAKQPKFKNKPKHLSSLWEVMGLRISESDLPVILDLLKDESLDAQLVSTLAICLDNIIEMTDDTKAKAKMGDQIFDSVPEKYRKKVITTLASACSAKALKYYKKRLKDTNNWPTEITFLAFWGNDDLVDYVLELHEANKDDKRFGVYAVGAVSGTFRQVRDRDSETAAKLMAPLYTALDADTSRRDELINKVDPGAADYVGDDSPELKQLQEEFNKIEACQKEKIQLAKTLGEMREYPWIIEILDRLAKDKDAAVTSAVDDARKKIKANTAAYAARKAKYLRRSKK